MHLFDTKEGLTREAFSEYLEWVLASLTNPEMVRGKAESHQNHLSRLRHSNHKLYDVTLYTVNAADYGAAQKRHRILIMGTRVDLKSDLPILSPSHTRERLLWDQWITGDYWKKHDVKPPESGPIPLDQSMVNRLRLSGRVPQGLPWQTVRDAIYGLGEPRPTGPTNHRLQTGARSYVGHTGSLLDQPSKALKAGVHGVPGGENMVILADGSVRYFSVREAARLQGLPDDFEFVGSWSENMRQLGNAVPVPLAETAALTLLERLDTAQSEKSMKAA